MLSIRSVSLICVLVLVGSSTVSADEAAKLAATIEINPDRPQQTFDGMGCGSIFYSGHITSFGQRKKNDLQEQLYDDIFKEVPTEFLHIMIRPDFEPSNDNQDPFQSEFKKYDFKKNRDALKVCQEAKKRIPQIKIYATLYSPPPWMKTNGKETAGGKEKATLKPGLETELGEYIWAYLSHMNEAGCPVDYLSICNEPDWTHTQPGYYLRPVEHAKLFRALLDYFEAMAQKDPSTPMPQLVAPNGISVIRAAKDFLPQLDAKSQAAVSVIGSHDYDRRLTQRWQLLREIAGQRPVWCTEWCWNGKDDSPDLIQAAVASWSVMCDGFNHGVNAWMHYDWVYPPRPGGEALIHVEWGDSYHRTKMYYAFRQWSRPLRPGMRVLSSQTAAPKRTRISPPSGRKESSESSVKTVAMMDPETGQLVVHIVNINQQSVDVQLKIKTARYQNAVLKTTRTSGEVSEQNGEAVTLRDGQWQGRLGPREMLTLQTPDSDASNAQAKDGG